MIIKEQCTGCSACMTICPVNAIQLEKDYRGFCFPDVDKSLCINCGQCDSVCTNINSIRNCHTPSRVIALKHKKDSIRNSSTSGGAFFLIASNIINEGGIVYGAAFTDAFEVKHIRCKTIDELNKLKKSKYVQSDLGNIFSLILQDIRIGKRVLFSGTACQCNGIKEVAALMRINTDNLITIDLICHGVPSPAIWKDYLEFRSRKQKITSVDFREKERSWRDFRLSICYGSKKRVYRQNEDYFFVLFFHNYILRDSCYSCKYSSLNRVSDITLGDFWGVEEFYPHFSDDKGISVVLVNTEKADFLIQSLLFETESIEIKRDELTRRQPNLKRPTSKNSKTEAFWYDYSERNFNYVIKKYADANILGILKRKYLFRFLHIIGLFDILLKIKNRNKQ